MSHANHVFHAGELILQRRAGVAESYRERVAHAIRPEMPQQHRDFFESLPVLFLGLPAAVHSLAGDLFRRRRHQLHQSCSAAG